MMKKLLIILMVSSCSAASHYQKIHGLVKTGTYTIKHFKDNVASFKEFPGEYIVLSDTLKPGDKITINIIRAK